MRKPRLTPHLRVAASRLRRRPQPLAVLAPTPTTDFTNPSSRRINSLIDGMGQPVDYLEVGLKRGTTFQTICARRRVGVEPDPRFSTHELPQGVRVFVGTSDAYFSSIPEHERFHVVFVDGLHHFEQAYRDVINSFKHLHRNGIVLIDDVVPSDQYSALRDMHEALRQRKLAGREAWGWHGDVFLTLLVLRDFHPQIKFRVAEGPGNPQAIAWNEAPNRPIRPAPPQRLDPYREISYEDCFRQGIPESFRPGHEADVIADAIRATRLSTGERR